MFDLEGADKTAATNEGEDNSLNQLGDEEWSTEDAALEKKDNDKQEESKEEDGKKESRKEDSAVYQKRRYREQLKTAERRINELEKKLDQRTEPLTEDEQKEQQARDALRKLLREELQMLEGEKSRAEQEAEEQLSEELEEVLDEHPDFSEKEILDVCEELTVTPKKAVKILERERKGKKTPPTLPQPRKASTTVDEGKGEKPKTFEDAGRHIKELLRKGKVY